MTNEKETPSLPTLDDVLHRRSQPPVCLYNYYIVLRDRLHLEQLLDFWLDVAQADIMYKRYLKYAARPSVHHGSNQPFSLPSKVLSQDDLFTHMLLSHPRTSFATTTTSTATVAKKSHPPPPTQSEMSDMLERIYLRYIVSDAEKELLLPHRIREEIAKHFTNKKPISTIPFKDAKQYVREELQHTFGIFLKYKGYMNLTWMQQVGRLVAGLIVLLVGFSYEFSMIFLDVKPWQTRLWGTLPIALGAFFVVSSLTGIDPLWVLVFNLSETVLFQFNPIVQTKVKSILRKRSLFIIGLIIMVTLILMIFFCSLAGNRL